MLNFLRAFVLTIGAIFFGLVSLLGLLSLLFTDMAGPLGWIFFIFSGTVSWALWVRRKSKTQPKPKKKKGLAGEHFCFTKVVGVTIGNRQSMIKKFCKKGDILYLCRQPKNRHDSNAIAVITNSGKQIGFISADLAEDFAPLMDQGRDAFACVTGITGGGRGESLGVNIELYLGS